MDTKILVDINVILDAVLLRDKVSKQLLDKLASSNVELFITASMIPTLDYFLTKYKIDKLKFKEIFFSRFSVITSSGYEALKSMDADDSEDALIAESFRRIAPDGIIISRDKNLNRYGLKVMTPRQVLSDIDNILKREGEISILNLQKQYRHIMETIDNSILSSIAEAKYILGPQVKEFENKLAEYIGTKHAIGVASGTDALLLSLRALAIKKKGEEYWSKDDLVITTPFTFTATGDTILRSGATPLFVDIDLDTYNIDISKIKEAIRIFGKKVVGILPVHLYGLPCNMDDIMEVAKANDLFVVEDCAQAFGSMYKGKKVGGSGDTGAFSFFPSKNLGAFGDAGAITTNDDELAEIIRMLRVHGGKDKYNVDHIGYKARLDTLQAAVLLTKLPYIDEFNEKRRQIAKSYIEGLRNVNNIKLPFTPSEDYYHNFHQFTIFVKDGRRDALQRDLKEKGIQTMIYYPVPLHKMKLFRSRSEIFGSLDNSEIASNSVLSLPIEPLMGDSEISEVISAFM